MDLSFYIREDDFPFEEDLQQNPYDIKTWCRYLESKRLSILSETDSLGARKQASRQLDFLYERALRLLPGSFKLWREYLQERVERVGSGGANASASSNSDVSLASFMSRECKVVVDVFERALLSMHRMPRIWIEYIHFLMQQQCITATRHVIDRALQALPITQHPRIWELALQLVHRIGRVAPLTAKSLWERYLQLAPEKRGEYVRFLRRNGDIDTAVRELAVMADSFMSSPIELAPRPDSVEGDEDESDEDADEEQVPLDAVECWRLLCELVVEHAHEITSISVESVFRTAIDVFKRDQGRYWTAFATYHVRRGHFDAARAVFEEALNSVFLVRGFAQVFDSYAKMEETLLEAHIERSLRADSRKGRRSKTRETEAPGIDKDVQQQMSRLEQLLQRHALLLNNVLLRQNPHSVADWLNRVKLVGNDPQAIVGVFEAALVAVNPRRASSGSYPQLWSRMAAFLEQDVGQVEEARQVFRKATEWGAIEYASVDDLAAVWIAWAEFEMRHGTQQDGVDVLAAGLKETRPKCGNGAFDGLCRSLVLWNYLIDFEEARGLTAATEAAYERMLQLRLTQPQHIINYALFMEETVGDCDAAFRVYERGIELFGYPVAFEIWNIYIPKFVARYAASRLERTRDLFEAALQGCPEQFARHLYMLYGQVEETHGLIRNALKIYHRGCSAVATDDRPALYALLIARTADSLGLLATRPLYEEAIRVLPDRLAIDLSIKYAAMEEKLGEIDRARALHLHTAQFCDPRIRPVFWDGWQEFETRHGNEQTFREMLRIKRSVQLVFAQKQPFVPASSATTVDETLEDTTTHEGGNEEEVALDL